METVVIEKDLYRRLLRQIDYFVFYLRTYGDAEALHHMAELDGFEVDADGRCNNPDCALCTAEIDAPKGWELLGEPAELPDDDPEVAEILATADQEVEEEALQAPVQEAEGSPDGIGEPVVLDGLPEIIPDPLLITWNQPPLIQPLDTKEAQASFLFFPKEAPEPRFYLGEVMR